MDFDAAKSSLYDRFIDNVTAVDDLHFGRQILDAKPVTESSRLVRRRFAVGRAFLTWDDRACITYSGGGNVVGPAEILADSGFCAVEAE